MDELTRENSLNCALLICILYIYGYILNLFMYLFILYIFKSFLQR